jgi:hypothetical protein
MLLENKFIGSNVMISFSIPDGSSSEGLWALIYTRSFQKKAHQGVVEQTGIGVTIDDVWCTGPCI